MLEKARQDVLAKEKAQAVEQEQIRQESEKRAWLRELQPSVASCQLKEGDENEDSTVKKGS